MAKSSDYRPPPRKEPGLIGKTISSTVALIVWLVLSLLISIVIEWIGMIWFWPEQGADHSQTVLASDQAYLSSQLYENSLNTKHVVAEKAQDAVAWVEKQMKFNAKPPNFNAKSNKTMSSISDWGSEYYRKAQPYLEAASTVTQTFVIRLALIVFSMPVFLLAGLIGAVDGLVERDLRRWGGGRESSNVFNLAKRSVVPAFVGACVIYISLPFSIDPVIVLLPFALLLGFAVRISFDRLKKYF
ncbi:TIGR03747 family integrating conjugative element membrane protein (plasmid) [Maricurvus nonylphenolicus]|uniref:TIGR03747 family integrating conjugative element membrane protein n=1 Tax=Maricurvus nonylphenolicus TaxID=1008307 RepID=UPI0036F34AFE